MIYLPSSSRPLILHLQLWKETLPSIRYKILSFRRKMCVRTRQLNQNFQHVLCKPSCVDAHGRDSVGVREISHGADEQIWITTLLA